MLREEADERVDYRAAKADSRAMNNHRKACDIYTHETANKDANRNQLSQNLFDKILNFNITFANAIRHIFFNQSITNLILSNKSCKV